MCVVGAVAFILYPLYLFLGTNPLADDSALSYYLAATCGAVAIAWGITLYQLAGMAIGRKMLATPSAIGFLLVALTRLFTVPYGTQVFHVFPTEFLRTAVPWIEVAVFGGLSLAFWRAGARFAFDPRDVDPLPALSARLSGDEDRGGKTIRGGRLEARREPRQHG